MKRMHLLTAAALAVAAIAPGSQIYADGTVDAKGSVVVKPGEEVWQDYPGIEGIRVMVVEGDLRKAGPYVLRVKFSPGVMSMPHHHPEDRLVAVLKGTWYTGTGPTFEPWNTDPLPQGSYMKHPAGEAHYDGAKDEEVILQISGMGPSGTIFENPDLGKTGNGFRRNH